METTEEIEKEIKRKLKYDHISGEIMWKRINPVTKEDKIYNTRSSGKVAGSVCKSNKTGGHRNIRILGKSFYAHRLAWFLYYGVWPKYQIDHINHNRDDNRLENLREVSSQDQNKNRAMSDRNTSGCVGVYYVKKT